MDVKNLVQPGTVLIVSRKAPMTNCPCCDYGLMTANSLDMEAMVCPSCHWSAIAWIIEGRRYAKVDKTERKQRTHESKSSPKLGPWSDNPGLLPAILSY